MASAASEASTADLALAASSSAVGRAGVGRAAEEEATGVGAAVEVEDAAEAPVRLTKPPVAVPGLAVKGDCQKGTVAPVDLAPPPPPPYGGIGAGGDIAVRAPIVGAAEEEVAPAREVEAAVGVEAEGVPPVAGVEAEEPLAGVAAPMAAPARAPAGALLVVDEAPG